MSVVRLGILGCGEIVRRVHLHALARISGVRVAALADPDRDRLAQAARRIAGASLHADHEDLLQHANVDAVLVALPPALHAPAAIAALDAGRHVYVEKPLAPGMDAARRMLAAEEASGAIGMVGFNFRFHPATLELREALRVGRLGRIAGVRTTFTSAAGAMSAWRTTRRDGGGALLDLASHHIDLLRFLFEQEIAEVCAHVTSVRHECDTAMVQLRLADGIPAQLFVSNAAVEEDRVEITGDAGKLTADRYASRRLRFTPRTRATRRGERVHEGLRTALRAPASVLEALRPPSEPSFEAALRAYVDAARSGSASPVPFSEGARSLAVVLAAEESARTGRPERVAAIS